MNGIFAIFQRFLNAVWNLLKAPEFQYPMAVITLLAFGILFMAQGGNWFRKDTGPYGILITLGEAMFVSGALAIAVDPLLKFRFQDQSGWAAIFGYLNPKAPEGLRKAVRTFTVCPQYFKSTHWTIHFEWENPKIRDVLRIQMKVRQTGVNLSRRKYKPSGPIFVAKSVRQHDSEFLHYSFTPDDSRTVLRDRAQLTAVREFRADGSLRLKQSRLLLGSLVPANEEFVVERTSVMYRYDNDDAAFIHLKLSNHMIFEFQGPAVNEIGIQVTRQVWGKKDPFEWTVDPTDSDKLKDTGTATPGQVTFVSWWPVETKITGEHKNP